MFKIFCWEKYFDASQQKNSVQWDSACDQTVKNLFTSIQTEAEDNAESLNNIIMIDKLVRCAPVSKEKKLAKELKNWAKKSSEKLLMLFMRQEICEIIIQNILKSSFNIHKMMFQNLSPEL